ncbi:MAG: hypothetical protein A4E29_00445 [Methanomassiliicoccales archaeon PtaB.Bin134]|nr:MAG: hypothetical protein A4E29_00445 [Methanomassiliicoccales archaeon PtaB.Bin134]
MATSSRPLPVKRMNGTSIPRDLTFFSRLRPSNSGI